MAFFLVVQKLYEQAGRDRRLVYINVVTSIRTSSRTFDELLQIAPWNDPTHTEFIVETTQQRFQQFQDGRLFLFHDGQRNEPRFQHNQTLNEEGSWLDPTDDTTTWRVNVPIPDDRFIVRIFAPPDTHVARMDLDENTGPASQDLQIMQLRLFEANGTPSTTNAQNQRTEIAGRLMIFDFTAGVTDFFIDRTAVGRVTFPSNERFRLDGPNGEKEFVSNVFGRSLRAPPE